MATKKVSVVLPPLLTSMPNTDRIIQKAELMMLQYGIRSVSMSDIAGSLGISKKTLYKSFEDKDSLVEAVIKQIVEENESRCLTDRKSAKDAIHEVFLALIMMEEMFANMNPIVLQDLEKFHPKAFIHFFEHKYNFLFKIIKENIKRGIAEGLYRDDVDVEIMTKLRLENMMLPFNLLVFPKNKFRLVEVSTALAENYLFGLATQKGYKCILKYKKEGIKKSTNEKK